MAISPLPQDVIEIGKNDTGTAGEMTCNGEVHSSTEGQC